MAWATQDALTVKSELRRNCQVCHENINGYMSYGALTCASCRVFFRRMIYKPNLDVCYSSGNCQITHETRTYCQSCRFQKCLAIGMDPNRVLKKKKKSKTVTISNMDPEKVISLAVEMLDLPKLNCQPFLQNSPSFICQPSLPFTFEENGFCQNLMDIKVSACRDNPLPKGYYECMLSKKKFIRPAVGQELKDCVQVFLERLIKFANDLDYFKSLPDEDQFTLLTMNLTYLYTFISADFLQSSYSGYQQMSIFIYGDPHITEHNEFPKDLERVEMSKLMPGVDGRHALCKILNSINDCQLDPIGLVLVMAISLFNSSDAKIRQIQDHCRLTLFRYLSSTMSPDGAKIKAEKIDFVLNTMVSSKDLNLLLQNA